ncbi:MAG: hypothetical protein KC766_28065 [Myxococcales bacterium]|nr:hypothetical protein [Myxococcales bacterium]
MTQLSPHVSSADWTFAPTQPGLGWLRWVCSAALVALLVWLGIASWSAEGDAHCDVPGVATDTVR